MNKTPGATLRSAFRTGGAFEYASGPVNERLTLKTLSAAALPAFLTFGGLLACRFHSFLLFHSAGELYSVLVAWSIFVIVWNTRRTIDNNYLLVLGAAHLCVGMVDILHTLAYEGMHVFQGGTNLAAQLWIVGRGLESTAFLAAPFSRRHRVNAGLLVGVYLTLTGIALLSIFYLNVFPVCYDNAIGLTPFKIGCEYVFAVMLAISLVSLWFIRHDFDVIPFWMLASAIAATILSELSFTFYEGPSDSWNMVGHLLKFVSFYLIYRAIVLTAFAKPYTILFRNLKESEARYRGVVEDQTELICRFTPEWALTFVNGAFCRYFARMESAMLGTNVLDLVQEGDRERVRSHIAPLRESSPIGAVEHRVVHGDGQTGWLQWTTRAFFDGNGVPIEYQSVGNDVTERVRAQEAAQFSSTVLQLANRHGDMRGLLDDFVAEAQRYTDCSAVGVRLLDAEGNIPYESYVGFSQEFYDSECPLSVKSHRCMCINVITGEVDARLPFYTENGSFYMNGTSRFLASASEEEKGETRNVCNRMGYESVALVPIRGVERILGLIHVADKRNNRLPLHIVVVLENVALKLGSALERVWAQETLRESEKQLRVAHVLLEQKVLERTQELTQTNRRLQNEVVQRHRLEHQLLEMAEEERRRIGRDLHDGLGQHLTGVALKSELLAQTLADREAPQTPMAREIANLVTDAISKTRHLSKGLLPMGLEPDSLMSALDELAHIVREIFSIECRFLCRSPILVEDDMAAIHLYRIAQEAVNNAAKHGRPTHIEIEFTQRMGRIVLIVRDDGTGFDPCGGKSGSGGLQIMRTRAGAIGGVCEVFSSPGKGTVVRCSRPIAAQQALQHPAGDEVNAEE